MTHASWAPVVAGGIVAIAGLSAGIGFQLVRNARQDESERIRGSFGDKTCGGTPAANAGDCNRLSELASDYDSFGTLELVSLAVGGAALIGTGAYFFAARPDKSRPVTQAHLRPVRLLPRLAKGSAGLHLSADF